MQFNRSLLIFSLLCLISINTSADTLQQRFDPQPDYHQRVIPWIDKHNEGVIRQQLDASCGAASLATLLKYYYGLAVSEADIMKLAGKQEWFSFADMASVLQAYKFKGLGIALNFDQLRKLKIPAVVYIKTRSLPHFAVLRGINDQYVTLADPAHGNNRYPVDKFLEKWNTRDDPNYKGKILVVVPDDTNINPKIQKGYFDKSPADNLMAEKLLNVNRNKLFY